MKKYRYALLAINFQVMFINNIFAILVTRKHKRKVRRREIAVIRAATLVTATKPRDINTNSE